MGYTNFEIFGWPIWPWKRAITVFIYMVTSCVQLTRDVIAIAKFLVIIIPRSGDNR